MSVFPLDERLEAHIVKLSLALPCNFTTQMGKILKVYPTLLLILLLLRLQATNAKTKVYMCYYIFGSIDPERAYYDTLDYYMPLEKCTHVIQEEGWFLNEAGSIVLNTMDSIVDSGEANTKLKAQKADVKFLVSVEVYLQFLDKPIIRSKYVEATQNFLTTTNMDGIDFKFETVGDICAVNRLPENPQLFAQIFDLFIDELRSAVPDKIFMITIEADPNVTALFNFKHLMGVMDYVNLKAYKSCMFIKRVTRFHAPLYASNGEFSVDSAVRQVLEAGVRRTKLIVSVRDGTQNFELSDPQNIEPGAPVETSAPKTSLQSYMGVYKHCEVCGLRRKYSMSWTSRYHSEAHSTYFSYVMNDINPTKTIWFSTDDLFDRGLYVSSMRLAGVSIYSFIHYDSTNPEFCRNLFDFQLLHSSLQECAWSAADRLAGRHDA